MSVAVAIILLAGFIGLAFHYWQQLFEEPAQARLSFIRWAAKGALSPLIVWILFNVGLSSRLPPLWPEAQALRSAGAPWVDALFASAEVALVAIASYWVAVTFGWMLTLIAVRSHHRGDFSGFATFWSVLLLPIAGAIIYFGGPMTAGLAVAFWLLPIVHFTIADAHPRKVEAMYSRAI